MILGDSERQVAEKFGEAAKTYLHNPSSQKPCGSSSSPTAPETGHPCGRR